jgi:hypothetical protein
MIPEERAARIVHRFLGDGYTWAQFECKLVRQRRPAWNRAVAFVADQIREAVLDALASRLDQDLAQLGKLGEKLEGLRDDLCEVLAGFAVPEG